LSNSQDLYKFDQISLSSV